jgi:hypothetical protein
MSGRSPRLIPLVRYADATARVEDVDTEYVAQSMLYR